MTSAPARQVGRTSAATEPIWAARSGSGRQTARLATPLLLLIALALFACLLPPAALAAPPGQEAPVSVEVTLDPSHATAGDPITLTVVIRSSAAVQVDTTGVKNQFAPFEILSAEHPVEQRGPNDTRELRLRYRVAVYRTGPLEFPALKVAYVAGGQPAGAQSVPVALTVDSVIPAGDRAVDIRAAKPQIDLPVPAPPPVRRIISGIALALAALVLLWRLWRLARRRVWRPALLVTAPVLPPLEAEAHAELDCIVAEGYLVRGDYAAHYARLAECIRRYVAGRYGFPATALTTAELNERMVRSGVGRWRARLVSGLLSECDAVHYARYLPAPARAEADLHMAYEIVDLSWSQETRPEEIRPEEIRLKAGGFQ